MKATLEESEDVRIDKSSIASLGGCHLLVSRHGSAKAVTAHRSDRAAVVRDVLHEAEIAAPESDRVALHAASA